MILELNHPEIIDPRGFSVKGKLADMALIILLQVTIKPPKMCADHQEKYVKLSLQVPGLKLILIFQSLLSSGILIKFVSILLLFIVQLFTFATSVFLYLSCISPHKADSPIPSPFFTCPINAMSFPHGLFFQHL